MRDMQDALPVAECVVCGGEIYAGEECWSVDGGWLHMDDDCVFEYLRDWGAWPIMLALGIRKETV